MGNERAGRATRSISKDESHVKGEGDDADMQEVVDMTAQSDGDDESADGKRKRNEPAGVGSEGECSDDADGSGEGEGDNEETRSSRSKKRSLSSRSSSDRKSRKSARSSSSESRTAAFVKTESGRRSRHTEQSVCFADIQAQEREISKIKSINKANADKEKANVALRKGVQPVVPASPRTSNSKRARARSLRQARQRMSPRSPEDPRLVGIRKGVPMVDLDDVTEGAPRKRRFANNADAIKDAVLHSTAWRNKKLDVAPSNILKDVPGITVPFAKQFDVPLSDYDDEQVLISKCTVVPAFVQPQPLSLTTGSSKEATHRAAVDERVQALVEEAVPLIKAAHLRRAKTIIANTRQQVRSYLARLPEHREKVDAVAGSFRPLQISRLEKVATRTILKNLEDLKDVTVSRYFVGRGDTALSEHEVLPGHVVFLSKIASLSRSTTCMGTRGVIRVEDDPIIRFVPLFSDENKAEIRFEEQFEGFGGGQKGFLAASDDETKEYLLRYVVAGCNGDPTVFSVLKEQDLFKQPQSDYVDIYNRSVREKRQMTRLADLDRVVNGAESGYTDAEKIAIRNLVDSYRERASGVQLRDRLEHPPTHYQLFHFAKPGSRERGDLGLKASPRDSYNTMAGRYQNFFCRRCFAYNCLLHGINQPIPTIRTDPRYPAVKASLKLHREMEAKVGNFVLDDCEDVAKEEENPTDEMVKEEEEPTAADAANGAESTADENDGEGSSVRRSVRSLTAASTKASSFVLAQRLKGKKKFQFSRSNRGPHSDVTEYLGQNALYRPATMKKRIRLLSPDQQCGPNCSKPLTPMSKKPATNGALEKEWTAAEKLLLDKVEKSLGSQPCVIAAILLTKSCSAVAEFLRQRCAENEEEKLIGYGVGQRDLARPVGARGNSHEHLRRTRHQRMKDRGANHEYVPCNHEGVSCNSGDCSCMRRDHYCEKACGCPQDCANRFPGCKCDPGQCRSASCPCFFAGRECDPDLCFACGACELPVEATDANIKSKWRDQHKMCGNVNILRGLMRKLGVAASETHGWGAYALEDIKKGDFIYEYTGDLLSQDEAERRGNVYDKTTISFLFDLNEDAVVDATRKGNKSKFANHTSTEPKCVARIMRVNGEHRIGIYANADIQANEELFFDYGYNGVVPDWTQARIVTGNSAKEVTEIEERLERAEDEEL